VHEVQCWSLSVVYLLLGLLFTFKMNPEMWQKKPWSRAPKNLIQQNYWADRVGHRPTALSRFPSWWGATPYPRTLPYFGPSSLAYPFPIIPHFQMPSDATVTVNDIVASIMIPRNHFPPSSTFWRNTRAALPWISIATPADDFCWLFVNLLVCCKHLPTTNAIKYFY